MATSVWKGHLTFGLVSIPIRLFAAARTERISLNQLHTVCHSRIRQPQFCPTCNRQIERSEIIKGFEYEKDQYVLFTRRGARQTRSALGAHHGNSGIRESRGGRSPLLRRFVLRDSRRRRQKSLHLLLDAMEESGHVAIAKLYMHQREYIVVIRPRAHGLTLHTMFYADEIRNVAEYGQKDGAEPKEQEKKLALQLIESLSTRFEPKKYHDEYRQSLRAMIEAKLKGQEVAVAPHPQLAPVVDLMEALKKSLAGGKQPAAKQGPVEMKPMKVVPEAVPARKRAGKRSAG